MKINNPTVLCDICGANITNDPCTATLQVGITDGPSPIGMVNKFYYEDTCKDCRHKLYVAIGREVHDLRGTG